MNLLAAIIPTPSPPRPECRSDPECPSREVCINNKCVNPCGAVPCGEGQLCSVVDSLPLRTVVCQCPADSFLNQNSKCVSAVIEEPNQVAGCTTDDTCPPEKACRNGVCEEPCDCAPTAKCRVIAHKPVCACPEGYTGDPPDVPSTKNVRAHTPVSTANVNPCAIQSLAKVAPSVRASATKQFANVHRVLEAIRISAAKLSDVQASTIVHRIRPVTTESAAILALCPMSATRPKNANHSTTRWNVSALLDSRSGADNPV